MIPSTQAELLAWFETNFQCVVGPTQAYFHLPISATEYKRWTYVSYAIATQQPEGEARVVGAMYLEFLPLLTCMQTRSLWWRQKPDVEHEKVQLLGKCLLTHEQSKDGYPVPPAAVRDFNSGLDNWFEDMGTAIQTCLYMRLVIPELEYVEYKPGLVKEDGYPCELLEGV